MKTEISLQVLPQLNVLVRPRLNSAYDTFVPDDILLDSQAVLGQSSAQENSRHQ